MTRRRDRHGRGLRGPLVQPAPGRAAWLRRRPCREEFFLDCVDDAVERVTGSCPGILDGIDIGIEEVPQVASLWDDRVPLAAAIDATAERPAQVVVFRRPLEHRAASRPGLRILVHRTLVEQLSALTGRSVADIDPAAEDEDLDD